MTELSTPTPAARRAEILVAALWVIAVIAATVQQGVTHQNNNFLIFRAASIHLVHGQDLYAAYPALHFDFYKYSPSFALLFLPFAVLPLALSMLLWNGLNAGALYIAMGRVLPRRAATIARAIVFLDMLGSLQNVQSNALVAGFIILTSVAYEEARPVLASFYTGIGTMIKIFPLAGASFAIFHRRVIRSGIAAFIGLVILLALPLVVTPWATLMAQYASWHAIESKDALERGFTVMQMAELLLRQGWPNWPLQLGGTLLLVAPVLLRRERWSEWSFRLTYLCSVLLFCVIFNHQSESPTFVIGVAGAAIWFAALARPTRWEWALFVFFVVCTILASSDAMPDALQRELFDRYRFKTMPCILLWIELQRRLWGPRLASGKITKGDEPDVAARQPLADAG
ncbi:MAG: glycosyltransferase family 87 protein [Gemmatimonadaceae bacterium]